MTEYFEQDLEDLNRWQKKVLTDRQIYGPAFNFLYQRDEEFKTEDLVEVTGNSSRMDDQRAGSLLGALRDEYNLIEGSLNEGSYHWNPELTSEGTWKDVKDELDRLNSPEKPRFS